MKKQQVSITGLSENKKWQIEKIGAEWVGQSLASLCWILSIFTYGLNSSGDHLQLIAASSWLFANIVSLHE